MQTEPGSYCLRSSALHRHWYQDVGLPVWAGSPHGKEDPAQRNDKQPGTKMKNRKNKNNNKKNKQTYLLRAQG